MGWLDEPLTVSFRDWGVTSRHRVHRTNVPSMQAAFLCGRMLNLVPFSSTELTRTISYLQMFQRKKVVLCPSHAESELLDSSCSNLRDPGGACQAPYYLIRPSDELQTQPGKHESLDRFSGISQQFCYILCHCIETLNMSIREVFYLIFWYLPSLFISNGLSNFLLG